ncbi:hypothetical protein RHSP_04762 [Rhizobium freirei PRF 81]|uniref:Uncharacterized protein n=1 Tax=Rhizobium freirei PRF 81 TaxID=363754 RepID=N6V0B1_9HYPH|nr:AAA family ATPase [Rhizobium freirei]ENN86441.1 hypothetical protein RHSP_04762 [Rhizobium freirei PRF 81]
MFISELRIENFRGYGEGSDALTLPLSAGLTALVGENDSGKTSIIDALRLALGTRDQESFRVDDGDFHHPAGGGERRTEIRIRCKFEGLTAGDKAAFAEHLSYEDKGTAKSVVLYLNWKAIASVAGSRNRRFTTIETRSGAAGDGPPFDQGARTLLCSTYLRPLRDAERAMSAGRGSRLSQILQHTREIKDNGTPYDPAQNPPVDPRALTVLGIGDFANELLKTHVGVNSARENLNDRYLAPLSFAGSKLQGRISVSGARGEDATRLRLLLEKLDLELRDESLPDTPANRGLGSNNLLFMACELLLLGAEADGFPVLLIEEPEAHLHPQRQLRLVQFLQQKANELRDDGQKIQIIITTHSTQLASAIALENLVLLHGRKAFPLSSTRTKLEKTDYAFLSRFLDVTKANLFFARGLLIVEGDAENILLPTIAKLIGRDLTENGVSLVNVGGVGLRRFARIYLRKEPLSDSVIGIPVACVTDLDVMPDCAPEIIGKVKPGDAWPLTKDRKWRAVKDFTTPQLAEKKAGIKGKASEQNVETFVADHWTLEYDLAFCGLAKDVWVAASLAENDDKINAGKIKSRDVIREALKSFVAFEASAATPEELATRVYGLVLDVSKPTVAQYLAALLEQRRSSRTPGGLVSVLPSYIVSAITHVTTIPGAAPPAGAGAGA